MVFSPDVLDYLAEILSHQVVSAADANFDKRAELVGRTRRELLQAIEAAQEPTNT